MGKSSGSKKGGRAFRQEQHECFEHAKAEVEAMLQGKTPRQQLHILHEAIDHEGRGMRRRNEDSNGRVMGTTFLGFEWTAPESMSAAIEQHRYILPFQLSDQCTEDKHRSH